MLDAFTEIFDDLNTVSRELGDTSVSQKLALKLKNKLSDIHTVEKLFSQLLQECRKDVLPDVVSGWDKMSQDEKHVLTRMNNVYILLIVGIVNLCLKHGNLPFVRLEIKGKHRALNA